MFDKIECEKIGGKWEEHGIAKITEKIKWNRASGCLMEDPIKISDFINKTEHLGTFFIPGEGAWLRTKTFNAYKMDDIIIVTNHYGTELINAKIYPNKKEFEIDNPPNKIKFRKYTYPLFPR